MTDAKVVSKNFKFSFEVPVKARVVEEEMGKILLNLGQRLNYKGKIIGHLKAIAVSGENYLQMSLTTLPNLKVKADSLWNEKEYVEIDLTVNIIVFGNTKGELENFLQESLNGSKLLVGSLK